MVKAKLAILSFLIIAGFLFLYNKSMVEASLNGWVYSNKTWYYYQNGEKLKSSWAMDSKGWCYLSPQNGAWVWKGWAMDSKGWCYIQNGYWVQHSIWAKDRSGWVHIGDNGYWDGKPGVSEIPSGEAMTVDISRDYGLKAGQTLYYNSTGNRHYYNSSFTQPPQKISDLINWALLDNKDTYTTIYIPAGEYLLDKPLIMQNGVTIAGAPGETRFIVDDTFSRENDDFIISNEPYAEFGIKDIYIEYKGFKNPVFCDTSINPKGTEGILLKIRNSQKAKIENCSFVAKNQGIKTEITPVWIRDNSSNIYISGCYIENTTGEAVGGCLWISNNKENISIYNNTLTRNGRDEAIAIWNDEGTSQDYNIYKNTINYTSGTENAVCDKLIAVYAKGRAAFRNIKFTENNINISGYVKRIMICDVDGGTFSNVVFEKNYIKDSTGDPTGNLLLTVFEVWCSRLSMEADISTMHGRCGVFFNYNSYTNSSQYGRRCLGSAISALLNLKGNTVSSNFANAVFYVVESENSRIISSGNDYNYSGTGRCTFANITGYNTYAYFSNDKIYLGGTSKTQKNLSFTACIFK
ncbi:MAG: glycosyl hydrolase family 28-related protein [Clostridiaceae bacterium]